jgi:hypothetical protein
MPKAYSEWMTGKGAEAQHLSLASMLSMSVLSATDDMLTGK